MAPLLTLAAVTLLARAAGAAGLAPTHSWPGALALGLAAMFLLTTSAHFTRPRREGLVAIVPPWVPNPGLAVSVTGILELAGAVGLVVPATRVAAALALGVLLLALFPANVYAARERRHAAAPTTPLVPRALMQAAYLAALLLVVFAR
jgi:uncharacterized membrane protein